MRATAEHITTDLLSTTLNWSVIQRSKCVLRRLFATKEQYCLHKDRFMIGKVFANLETEDAVTFDRLLVIIRQIAVYRPANLFMLTKQGELRR